MSITPTTTRIKDALNLVLHRLGLELITTRKEQSEQQRLQLVKKSGHWDIARYHGGVAFQDSHYLAFLENITAEFKNAYSQLRMSRNEVKKSGDFYLNNGWFESVDAEIYYCLIQKYEPQTIIEVGSGNSTRLAQTAISDAELNTILVSIDPNPRVPVTTVASEHIASEVEALAPDTIAERLQPNDILFIDSSHQILAGGDVPFLYLEVLPRLKPGVLVHIHDIFLPFDYPEEWIINRRWTWNEQYLVHAFLCYNKAFEIVWPSHYMWQTHREAVQRAIPSSKMEGVSPTSLWLRKVE